MPGFTDRFGGSAVNPSDVGYLALPFSVNTTLTWPSSGGLNVVARLIDATPAGAGLTLTLPDAREASKGFDTLITNLGANTFTVLDAGGNTIGTVVAGGVRYFYLTDTSTLAGVWRSLNIGSLTSTVDAATLDGLGLRAVATELQTNLVTSTFAAGFTIAAADRAKVLVWTGGTGTLTLPLLNTLDTGFHFEIRNQGTGVLTVTPSGGQLIDGAANLALQPTESVFIHAGATAWYTIGRGRNTQFSFTQLTKTITGGTTVLTPTEAANVVQKYVGVLVSNAIVEFPAYVQVYYVSNQTTGAFSVTFKNAGAGSVVAVPQGQSAVLFSDGTNVTNANTTAPAIPSLTMIQGTQASPSLNYLGDTTTGYFQPAAGILGGAVLGAEVYRFTVAGLRITPLGTVAAPAYSFQTDPNTGFYSPGADLLGAVVNGVEVGRFSAGQFSVVLGSAGVPSYSFTGDLNTGIYSPGAEILGVTVSGVEVGRFSAGQFSVVLGSAGAPSYSFTGDLNTGIYSPGAEILGVTVTGVEVGRFSAGQFSVVVGAVGAPSYAFTGDLNTGIYSPGAGQLAVSIDGVQAAAWSANRNFTLPAPAAGVGFTGTGFAGSDAFVYNGGTSGSFRINDRGLPYGTTIHNNAGSVAGITNQVFASGSYTPTVTNSANTSARSGDPSWWIRLGNIGIVGLNMTIDPTAADTATEVIVTLPPTQSGNFAAVTDACGVIQPVGSDTFAALPSTAYVYASTGAQTVRVAFTTGTNVGSRSWSGVFVYSIF